MPSAAASVSTVKIVFQPLQMRCVRAVTSGRKHWMINSFTTSDGVVANTTSNGFRNAFWKL